MKVKELIVKLPKARNQGLHKALGATKGGPMRDKKKEAERGKEKHKGKMDEAKDVLINNIRDGNPMYAELMKLAATEIKELRAKKTARVVNAAKKYKGAGFAVVSNRDGDIYFRIDKADISEEVEV